MLTWDVIWKFGAVSLAIVVSPGASWAYVIESAARGGMKNGLRAVAGNGTGILIHATVAAAGLMTLLRWSSETVLLSLRWGGAAYLCYLSLRTFAQVFHSTDTPPAETAVSLSRTFRNGVLVNVLNPKVMLLMVALLPQFLRPEQGSIGLQIFQLGLIHAVIASTLLSGLALLTCAASQSEQVGSPRMRSGLRLLSAIVLLVCAAGMLAGS